MNALIRHAIGLACCLWLAAGASAAAAPAPSAAPLAAAPAASPVETRAPSARELASFQAFYQKQYPGAPAVQPVFRITRPDGKSPWSIAAHVEAPPKRGLRTLCRMDRAEFSFDRQWRAAERVRQFVWLQQGACTAGPQAAELLHRMPDADVLLLLSNQAAALPKARLIMAGNSGCAPLRSFPFRFAAIDVGPSGSGNEEMAGLVYRRESMPGQVTVWVRRSATGIDNWNVSCPPRGKTP